jgi:hypothetical protein
MRQPLALQDATGRRHDLVMACRVRTTAPTQQREWALAGLGVTRLPRFLVAEDLAAGRLAEVRPDHRYEGPSLFAVYAREAAGSVRVKALLAHLRAHTRHGRRTERRAGRASRLGGHSRLPPETVLRLIELTGVTTPARGRVGWRPHEPGRGGHLTSRKARRITSL